METGVKILHFIATQRLTSRPVNTLSVGFSDSIWRTTFGLPTYITPPIALPVKICQIWHADTVSEECSRSPAASKYYGCLDSKTCCFSRDLYRMSQNLKSLWRDKIEVVNNYYAFGGFMSKSRCLTSTSLMHLCLTTGDAVFRAPPRILLLLKSQFITFDFYTVYRVL